MVGPLITVGGSADEHQESGHVGMGVVSRVRNPFTYT